jgi:hypothetical protein
VFVTELGIFLMIEGGRSVRGYTVPKFTSSVVTRHPNFVILGIVPSLFHPDPEPIIIFPNGLFKYLIRIKACG